MLLMLDNLLQILFDNQQRQAGTFYQYYSYQRTKPEGD